jgi:LysM repeat protein
LGFFWLPHFSSMDTISRENNSMLPVGGIIVGVIALLLGGYAAISLSKVNRLLAEHQTKIDKVDGIESTASAAAATADKASKGVDSLTKSANDAVAQISNMLGDQAGRITKLEEAAKKPVVTSKKGAKGGGDVVAGPGEYVVKPGDTGMKIASAHGVTAGDLVKVNPGVNFNKLKPGDKLKLPEKK